MTMTEPAVSKLVTLRGAQPSACPLFPAMQIMQCPLYLEDAAGAGPGVAWEDWDLLFRAVLETCARVAREPRVPDDGALRLQSPDEVFRGCLEALDQLRKSVPHTERAVRERAFAATGT